MNFKNNNVYLYQYFHNDLFYLVCLILIFPLVLISTKVLFLFSIVLGLLYIIRYRHIEKSLRYFAPFILTVYIYTLYVLFINDLTIGVNNIIWDLRVQYGIFSYHLDRFIFVELLGTSMPSFWIYKGSNISGVTIFFSVIYLLQPIIFLSFLGIKIYQSFRNQSYGSIETLSIASLITLIILILIFALFPTPPPWYVFAYGIGSSNFQGINQSLAAGGISNLQLFSIDSTNLLWKFSSIKFGSFPSIHVYTSSYLFLYNKQTKCKSRYFFFLLMLSNMGEVIYLGQHFLTDVLFGFVLAFSINKLAIKIN